MAMGKYACNKSHLLFRGSAVVVYIPPTRLEAVNIPKCNLNIVPRCNLIVIPNFNLKAF